MCKRVCRGLSRLRQCSDALVWQYLILANGARGRAAVALIQQAIANPQLFHFGELIDHENIAALDGTCSHCFATRVSSRAAKVFVRPDGLFVLRVKGSRVQAEKGEERRKHVPCWCQVRGFLDADADECLCLTGVPDTKPWLDLLKLFAFGTYAEYKSNNANLPQLDDAQALKLKQLTIVSLAAETKVIPYDTLLSSLDLSDTRTLEDCIIEGMYAGLFSGKLDQKTKEFHVTETAGRDVKPGEISDMISVLKAWVEVRAFSLVITWHSVLVMFFRHASMALLRILGCASRADFLLMVAWWQAAEDTSAKIQDKISYAETAQEVEDARAKELQGKVDELKKNTSGDMDMVQGAGHSESMDMDDVSGRLPLPSLSCKFLVRVLLMLQPEFAPGKARNTGVPASVVSSSCRVHASRTSPGAPSCWSPLLFGRRMNDFLVCRSDGPKAAPRRGTLQVRRPLADKPKVRCLKIAAPLAKSLNIS